MSRRRKELTNEDRSLWASVAKTTRPLPGRMERLMASSASRPSSSTEASGAAKEDAPAPLTEAMRKALAQSFQSPRADQQTSLAKGPSAKSGPSPIERPVQRKLARGRLPLEARIDLHGLDQATAHARLLGFVERAHSDGLRHVLVITGKGASFGSEGALKRSVPHWLAKSEFSRLVSGYEQASRGHGGEGALYIRLKKKRSGIR
ncbi:Smr/MutS family protein [Pararhizobium haloflavum]|uniref:Smr/MutS family protein n=1 Tax=Pararhizobium haloflavum TaxID=2037914 RepID=UPI000C19B593|nr:Smr/MutS family protein [Pararhizobium haloflavum]